MKKIVCLFTAFLLTEMCLYHSISYVSASPGISAEAGVLMELSSQDVLMSENANKQLPMASTTKIMTALVALENCDDLSCIVRISEKAVGIEGSSVYLKAGEELTMEQLLQALLLESANDAAAAIAVEIAGDIPTFAEMMNDTAQRLGLTNTHFTNPHGLDEDGHFTTAYDLARLTCYALQNADFQRIVSTYKATIPMCGEEGARVLVNHNRLLKSYSGSIGVKTGYTKRCGRCLVSAAERDGVTMIAVTLNDPDDWRDHSAMLDYGFSRYAMTTLAESGEYSYSFSCLGGTSQTVTASNRDEVRLPLPVDHGEVSVKVEANRYLCAPIREGDEVGELIFRLEDTVLARIPLYAVTASEKYTDQRSAADRLKDLLRIS